MAQPLDHELHRPPRLPWSKHANQRQSHDVRSSDPWRPLDDVLEEAYGSPSLQYILQRPPFSEVCEAETGQNEWFGALEETKTVQDQSSSFQPRVGENGAGKENRGHDEEEILPKDDMSTAFQLVQTGARAPSGYISCDADLQQAPPEMIGFPGAVASLWPHQLAGIGRLEKILKTYFCALLAWEMGLGKSFVVLAILIRMGLMASTRPGPVLIVVPRSLLGDWYSNLTTKTYPSLKVCVYHDGKLRGQATTTDYTVEDLKSFDIVLTTYTLVRMQHVCANRTQESWNEWLKKKLPYGFPTRARYPLFGVNWWILALDEAHIIANPVTKSAQAACALRSEFRVAVTGTPLQNEYTDVQGLLAFMKVAPWSDLKLFKEFFLQKKKARQSGSTLLSQNVTTILANTLQAMTLRLRVTDKFNGVPVAQFQPAKPYSVTHELTPEQIKVQDVVKHIWDKGRRKEVERARKRPGYIGPLPPEEVFPAITSARLSLVHPECAHAAYGELGEEDILDGPDGLSAAAEERFLHAIENDGLGALATHKHGSQSKSEAKRKAFREKMVENWESPRMTKLLKIIRSKKAKDRHCKVIIFSEFLCALDVADAALSSRKYKCARYDGWVSQASREKAEKDFMMPENDVDFLLMTNRCGGLGLNLPIAKVVIHLTPCWNPALTAQCTGRAARPGQRAVVDAYNFCAKESMEQHVRALSMTKRKKSSQILDPSPEMKKKMANAANWTIEEFKSIMSQARTSASEYETERKDRQARREQAKQARKNAHDQALARAAAHRLQHNQAAMQNLGVLPRDIEPEEDLDIVLDGDDVSDDETDTDDEKSDAESLENHDEHGAEEMSLARTRQEFEWTSEFEDEDDIPDDDVRDLDYEPEEDDEFDNL